MFYVVVFNTPTTNSELSMWRKDEYLMQAINALMITFITRIPSEELYPLWDNRHLKIRPIYTKSFVDKNNSCVKIFIILSVKKRAFCVFL